MKQLKRKIQTNRVLVAMVVLLFASACKDHKSEQDNAIDRRPAANETEQHIYRSGDSMLAAFKRKDWMTFVKYNHPGMTSRMGGAAAFASFINLQMKQIPDTAIKSISIGKVLQVVKTRKDQQCVVEQNMKMELNGTTLDKTTYLVGESLDNGNTWTFFDASTKTGLTPKDIKPDISSELKIPPTRNEVE